MTPQRDLAVLRRAYARRILAAAQTDDPVLEDAFAAVRREDFLGPGPWPILRAGGGYVQSPSADPLYLYDDVLVGLVTERGLNNGQPSFHALLLGACRPRPGEALVHVGAGTGYYSAVMAELVGPSGQVTAVEVDPDLAARAKANLAPWPQAEVIRGDGAAAPLAPADVIYVNAGATGPSEVWLDALRDGGRLMLPLTAPSATPPGFAIPPGWSGVVFRIERRGAEYLAAGFGLVAIIPGEGLREPVAEAALTEALAKGRWREVTRLYRRAARPSEDVWAATDAWTLAYR